ncbi:guanine deaminase [Reinekea marinisedimentorum]|uniref:Guanine deaminase n=1 Tax=Reinekea marinisedimentorum TaxID=230495 RepID=A0A4R3IBX0_9GAMM|nr:guanine deaminase [Reinekea marinisedimentorum]TCS43153.1 guanine deaminase [Reinekea marinisedimentorum]
MQSNKLILCADLLDLTDDPLRFGEDSVRFQAEGALVIEGGKIVDRGTKADMLARYGSSATVKEYENKIIVPGFIDTHIHLPQTEMIAAYGEQLLTWLKEYAFPTEMKFADYDHAKQVSEIFLNELLRNGTTTALVFGTVHPQSVEAFFESAQARGLRMIAGKVMMDRNCPDELQDTAEQGYQETKALIEKWHGVDRLSYAVTPRFAPTSTPEQLNACQKLLQEYPDVYMHTHTSENVAECEWVKELYPNSQDYVGVYEDAGLLRKRSVLAHGIHLNDREIDCLCRTETAIAHCPTSNLFIGSGLFRLKELHSRGVQVAMGTDIGAGTSFSMLQTFNEAYKVQQLQGNRLTAFEGLYLSTLAGARALDLEGVIGQLEPGCEADLVVLDPEATPLMQLRLQNSNSLHEKLFALMMLGDDRCIFQTYSFGQLVHSI